MLEVTLPVRVSRQSRAHTCLSDISGDKQTDPLSATKDASATQGFGGTLWHEA